MTQLLVEKWSSLLDHEKLSPINDQYKREVTAQLLENNDSVLQETTSVEGMAQFSPIVMSMVRRNAPRLVAYDVCGVQPLTMPTGLIFAIRARYTNKDGDEALFDKIKTGHSGDATDDSSYNDGTENPFTSTPTVGKGLETVAGEKGTWNAMSATIESINVTSKTRHLRADYSLEVQQDWKAVHNIDAQLELSQILAQEILVEKNQELVRTIYTVAKPGAQSATTKGTFDLKTDSDGRHLIERFKGLVNQINRDANRIAIETRRGRGNLIICSADVASALQMAGILDFTPALQTMTNLDIVCSATYAGNIGPMRVYIDPYVQHDGYVVGYKGAGQFDAGLFYCPYVDLQPVSAVSTTDFRKSIGFQSRYALVSNPFTTMNANENVYYRKAAVKL